MPGVSGAVVAINGSVGKGSILTSDDPLFWVVSCLMAGTALFAFWLLARAIKEWS